MVNFSEPFYIYFIMIQINTIFSQFLNHVDLQKVGEVALNKDKFNVLKPTLHVVSDYFKDFMMRSENEHFPSKRVFIDKNGFRHFWSVLGDNDKSHRKTDTKENLINYNTKATNNDVGKTANKTDITNNSNVKKKPKRKKEVNDDDDKLLRQSTSNKTVAKTSFFCPFFGIITMTAFVD
ncbi:uncharacterized protein LOC113523205 [Galleria mellonella]|uniref:Uncharacterized protein LOC113523205 n=1 Tax=Galleria mellonella TaxID=7137 RepID=A0A6J1X9C7_GALME|nr:uncharacterized protein LOC113523205 [Galleria mellonella]